MIGAIVIDNVGGTQHPTTAIFATEKVCGILDGGLTACSRSDGDCNDVAIVECNLLGWR